MESLLLIPSTPSSQHPLLSGSYSLCALQLLIYRFCVTFAAECVRLWCALHGRPDGGMVDTRDLKSLGHYGCTSSSLVSGTSLLLSCSAEGNFFAVSFSSLYVYGVILPQRGKKQRKTDILFCRYVKIDMPTLQNHCV